MFQNQWSVLVYILKQMQIYFLIWDSAMFISFNLLPEHRCYAEKHLCTNSLLT